MPRDVRAYLWDARQAIGHLRSFIEGKNWDDYAEDVLLRSGVERQFEIIGEALNSLSKAAPNAAARIDDLPRIVAFWILDAQRHDGQLLGAHQARRHPCGAVRPHLGEQLLSGRSGVSESRRVGDHGPIPLWNPA